MASSSYRGGASGSFYGDAAPYRSRDGLSTRPVGNSDEIQLRIDPMQSDLDDEITGLHSQVKQLKNIAQEIGTEAKFQKDFLDELQMTLMRAQAGVKNNIRKLNMSIIRSGNNHVMHVVLFALLCFFVLYMWSKMFKR
ncbi:PREDICTED: bet1-like protein At4g14600 [Tarenaya hassleriana]|uniref:bet1-like protein At4g14600 n=1 Tax=Tarenaya hassleriana TaxID=28532 RepID=UPI00053C36A8|nr:PREDICTED: bet1-like protein At4g14600 [Tarenaya hassleriana]